MTSTQPLRIIAVVGATGTQGKGVVRALLDSSTSFHVRAITRGPESPTAQQLLSENSHSSRLSVVRGDVYDADSLLAAFDGAYGVFAMTQNFLPGRTFDTEDDLRHELDAGQNIINAAETSRIKHFVFSSLPSITEASNGRYTKVFHFDFKAQIEQWARDRLAAVTILVPGMFYGNLLLPTYCRRDDNGTVRFCPPLPGHTLAGWVDAAHDVGVFARAVFLAGPEKTASKTYPIESPQLRVADLAGIFSKVTSEPARFEDISLEEWTATVTYVTGKGFEEDIRQMAQWVADAPPDKIAYGTMSPQDDTSWEDLGVKATTFEEWLNKTNWKGP
ncbi:hypothetical protein QQX98_002325 [Neonectria punicea]|uniref:NmrA-like domain-containing protein n=1 Tax=Neonectria punicea TaxID=979145 RepID=A0ABR1HJ20_9HYPO